MGRGNSLPYYDIEVNNVQGGFSFCGVDIETIGLHYAPSLADTYIFKDSQYSLIEETFNSHDGGYFYGTSSQPKTFTLRCYFEDSNINDGIMTKVGNLFRRGKTGKLLFRHREWIWYNATVVNVDYSALTNYMNGFITISMKAYYPFGRFDYISIVKELYGSFIIGRSKLNNSMHVLAKSKLFDSSANTLEGLINNSGLLFEDMTPDAVNLASSSNKITTTKKLLLYNGGTLRASVAILIGGNFGTGVTITNHTTGQTCKFVGLKDEVVSSLDYIVCDGLNGKTIAVTTTGETSLGFIYHDGGFIELLPSTSIKRNITVKAGTTESNVVLCNNADISDVGKYVYINDAWHKITGLSGSGQVTGGYLIEDRIRIQADQVTDIVTMNEITVLATPNNYIDKLNFIYKPTFK